jgi:hypothetical protein
MEVKEVKTIEAAMNTIDQTLKEEITIEARVLAEEIMGLDIMIAEDKEIGIVIGGIKLPTK